jgi:hypothetical protein
MRPTRMNTYVMPRKSKSRRRSLSKLKADKNRFLKRSSVLKIRRTINAERWGKI